MEKIQPSYPSGLTFEQVWASLQDTHRLIEESKKETDRQIKEMRKKQGEYDNRFGEVVEHMIAPNLRDKFRELGYVFERTSIENKIEDFNNNIFFEVDVLLENSEKAMLVEIKTKLTNKYVNDHIERLNKMRRYADFRGDKRVFLGASAGVIIPSNVKDYALSKGLFVIKPSGETFNITAPRSQPKEW